MGSWIRTPSSSTSSAAAARRYPNLARPVHRVLLCLLLTAGVAWLGYAALLTQAPFVIAECLLALLALGFAVSDSRFTRYPVILLALLLSCEWLTSVILSMRIGYFAHQRPEAVVLALLPGVLMEGAALYASIVAVAYCSRR